MSLVYWEVSAGPARHWDDDTGGVGQQYGLAIESAGLWWPSGLPQLEKVSRLHGE